MNKKTSNFKPKVDIYRANGLFNDTGLEKEHIEEASKAMFHWSGLDKIIAKESKKCTVNQGGQQIIGNNNGNRGTTNIG